MIVQSHTVRSCASKRVLAVLMVIMLIGEDPPIFTNTVRKFHRVFNILSR